MKKMMKKKRAVRRAPRETRRVRRRSLVWDTRDYDDGCRDAGYEWGRRACGCGCGCERNCGGCVCRRGGDISLAARPPVHISLPPGSPGCGCAGGFFPSFPIRPPFGPYPPFPSPVSPFWPIVSQEPVFPG